VHVRPSGAEDRWLPWLLLATLLSRLPLLAPGFGSETNAWRNAVAALHMRELGHYQPIRLPGAPVFDGITTMLVAAGPFATNAAAAIAGTLAVLAFVLVARRAGVYRRLWPTLAFAFGPPLWVSATQTIDFSFGLALVLFAYLAALGKRGAWAGLLLALATGCRGTFAWFMPPMLMLLVARGAAPGAVARYLISFLVVTTVLVALVLARATPGELAGSVGFHMRHLFSLSELVPVLRAAAVSTLGKLGTIAAIIGLVASRFVRRERLRRTPDHGPVVFELWAVTIVAIGYLLFPFEGAYTIGAVPFLLLLLGRALSPTWLAVTALAIVSESFVTPQITKPRLDAGRVFAERALRVSDEAATRALLARTPAEPTVFEVGRLAVSQLMMKDPTLERTASAWAPFRQPTGVALWSRDRRLGFASALEPVQRDSLAAAGYRVVADSTLRR
jgi:hypothetical protein